MSRPRGTVLMNGLTPKTLVDYGINPDETGRYICPKSGCGRRFDTLAEKKKHVRTCDV